LKIDPFSLHYHSTYKKISIGLNTRDVKVGQNPWANPTHHKFGPGWVEIFLKISVRVNLLPDPSRTRLTRVGSPTHLQIKGHTIFFVFGLGWAVTFCPTYWVDKCKTNIFVILVCIWGLTLLWIALGLY